MLYGAMNFPVRPVLDEFESVSRLGFDYLELAMDPPQAHHHTIRRIKDELLAGLRQADMALVCHLPAFLSTADLTPSVRTASLNEVLQSLDTAAELNPLKLVLHPSYITGLARFVIPQARQYAMESLEVIVRKADDLGLRLCIENMFPRILSRVNPEDFVEILEAFPSLGLTLDTGHANIGSDRGQRALDFIERFPDRIGHVHANDNLGKEDNHLPIGTGTVDFPRIVKALKRIGYDETVTFEVFSQDREYLTISREKFATMLDDA